MEKRELPDIHEPKKSPMSDKKKQSILEKLCFFFSLMGGFFGS